MRLVAVLVSGPLGVPVVTAIPQNRDHGQPDQDRPGGEQQRLEEHPAIVKVANSWIIMNPGGGPTPDKPEVTLAPPEPGDPVSAFINVRVADIASFHREATAKGAQFLTEPLDRKAELRCYLRDTDGYLVEVGQATGMLEGVFADPPAGNQR